MALLVTLAEVVTVLFALVWLSGLLSWIERRLLGFWQDRLGPDPVIFIAAPVIVMATVLLAFVVIPAAPGLGIAPDLDIGLLFFLAMTSLGVYGVVLAGWASNSKFSLLGGMRAAAQMISYEVFMGLAVIGVVMLSGSFNLTRIVEAQRHLWFVIPQFLGFVPFVIAGIAETHRLPFDLPEGENELGAGYHTEYSGMKFGMFFVGEYAGMILIAAITVTLYFGGWYGPILPPWLWFGLKTAVLVAFFILLRAALPRPRYDQLMSYGWKLMLPLSILNLAVTGGLMQAGLG